MTLIYIAIGWVIGIWFEVTYPPLASVFWVGLGIVLITVFAIGRRQFRSVHWLMLILIAVAWGAGRTSLVPRHADVTRYHDKIVVIRGTVDSLVSQRELRQQFAIQVDTVTDANNEYLSQGRVLVWTNAPNDLIQGDTIRISGRLSTPAEYDTFSYADYLAQRQIFSIMENARILEIVESTNRNTLIYQLHQWRERAKVVIQNAIPEPQSGLLVGILLGDEQGLSPDVEESFARTGTAHIIAISGFNMVVIAEVLKRLLGLFTDRKWGIAIVIAIVLVVYTIFVGGTVAIWRATLMSLLLIVAPLFNRKTYVPASLALALLIITMHNPLALWDISFQLSFMAVIGISLFTDPLSRYLDRLLHVGFNDGFAQTLSRILQEPLVVTLAAMSTTLPLTMLYFQRFSIVSLPVNAIIVPVQSYILYFGAIATLIGLFIPFIGQFFFWIVFVLLSFTLSMVRWTGDLSFADVVYQLDSRLVLLLLVGLVGVMVMDGTRPPWVMRYATIIRNRLVLTTVFIGGLILSILMLGVAMSRSDGQLHVWFLDMGHSNSILMQTPNGAQILIDGGRYPTRLLTALGDRMPFYDRKIETIILTQPDIFDIGAVESVLSRYDAGVILWNGQPSDAPEIQNLLSAMLEHDVVEVTVGYTLQTDDGVMIEVLHPFDKPTMGITQSDASLILRVTYDDISFILPNDASIEAQENTLRRPESYPVGSVLMLPQHGGERTLSHDFYEAVQAQVVILQSDIANRRGDPADSTLAMLGDTPLFRTDTQGTLHLISDGHTLTVQTER